ncbi:protein FAM83B-like [Dunckerocampus dactyliophorus]|uniref:protein FAM83B-like n=1 Tax=Dunckerocampus dactyliophorus TaxID=161453 RepID=UPI00240574EC|nr:protein FAM83B-like [Dunckerocampus dactyliophorus]XP_054636404.1 protein FAM83B-like [Dunckerocampus dactyliophorus]
MVSNESNLSCISSLKDDEGLLYIQPHYKESYRLAIYALLCGGKAAYEDFLQAEQISHFLSEEEILFILENAEVPVVEDDMEGRRVGGVEPNPSTYFPVESDEEVPDLDLGWPEVTLDDLDTSISLLFHPPRPNTPTIKEVVRKQIQEAKQVVAIAMDVFTDVDIFKEVIGVTLRGVVVYILLDEAQFGSFHAMSQRVGVNIQDLKNIRVRTVRGQQYHCQSGMKFHGSLEQRFILVDCRTVLYGTYSYTWSFEKINLSMVLVVTGQLVCSYDEEFRRLYARSSIPEALYKEYKSSMEYLLDGVALRSPNSSQLSLHQIHMRSRGMHGLRSAQEDRFGNAVGMARGLSMQDHLHQSHFTDMGHMVRGHSFGAEFQRLNPVTRLKMGTKDIVVPVTPDRPSSSMLVPNRMSHQHIRHQSRYGPDHTLIPFNSETSLHRWKMDTYLNSNVNLDASCDVLSPVTSPYSSRTGLNEHQPHMIHSRPRDIKSRLEEIRQKRLSLQEYNNLRQSQESLRSMYQSLDRPKFKSSLTQNVEGMSSLEQTNHRESGPSKEDDSHCSRSYFDIQTAPEIKTTTAYDWHEPLSRTSSATHLDEKLKEPSLKYHSGLQRPRTMESLIEIPEEKEGSSNLINSYDGVRLNDRIEDEKKVSTPQAEVTTGNNDSLAKQSGSATAQEKNKSLRSTAETAPQILTTSASEVKTHQTEKDVMPQRKNSMRTKSSEEKKASKKEDKSLQRKASLKSQNSSGCRASPTGKPSTAEHQASQNSINRSSESEKPKSSFNFSRLSSHRSSKRKTNQAAEQEQGSQNDLEEQEMTAYESRREKAYSRYEYLLRSSVPLDKAKNDSSYPTYGTAQGGAEKKLGRFMQRVGNLIGKNK